MIIFVQKSEHAGFRNNLSQERIVHQGCPCQLHFHRRVLNLVIFLYINLEKKINSPIIQKPHLNFEDLLSFGYLVE